MPEAQPLLTIKGLSRTYGWPERWIMDKVESGDLLAYSFNGALMFSPDQIKTSFLANVERLKVQLREISACPKCGYCFLDDLPSAESRDDGAVPAAVVRP